MTPCIAWILWVTLASGTMGPMDSFGTLKECKDVAAQTFAREQQRTQGASRSAYQCFPHTVDPRSRGDR